MNQHLLRKGDYLPVTLDDRLHQIGLQEHEHSLIGRMMFKSGIKTMPSTEQLKAALQISWGVTGSWKIVPVGNGYFNISIDNIIEQNHLLFKRSWPSEFGTMRLQTLASGL